MQGTTSNGHGERKTMGRRRALALAMGLAAAVAGCGGDDTRGAAGSGTATTGARGLRIAMIAKSSNNPVFLAARTGAETAAKELSAKHGIPIEVVWLTPPQEDPQVQAQRIGQAVNEGASAVLLSASDAGKVTGAIDDAVARGVPVMMFDSDAPQSRRFAFYGVDDVKTGQAIMAQLVSLMGGKGKIAMLAGNQNAPNLQRRVQGARDEAAKHPGIEIVGTFHHVETPQDAAAEVTRVGNAYPELQGWAMIGGWALFSPSLLTDLDPARVKVAALDALPAQLAYIDKGITPVLLAQQPYMWGYVGVSTIVDKVHLGKEVPTIIPQELVRVSKESLGSWAKQLRDWGFTDVDPKYFSM